MEPSIASSLIRLIRKEWNSSAQDYIQREFCTGDSFSTLQDTREEL
jgi:hypothetical protein